MDRWEDNWARTFGAVLLIVVGVALAACGVILDRDWVAGMGVVLLVLGVVLPLLEGDLEFSPLRMKARIRKRIRQAHLPPTEEAKALEAAAKLSVIVSADPAAGTATVGRSFDQPYVVFGAAHRSWGKYVEDQIAEDIIRSVSASDSGTGTDGSDVRSVVLPSTGGEHGTGSEGSGAPTVLPPSTGGDRGTGQD